MSALRVVEAVAPVRVCDVGGWTDTWFAAPGAVCGLAAGPGARVRIARGAQRPRVRLAVASADEAYAFPLAEPPGRHPLLEGAIALHAPPARDIDVHVEAPVPPGSGLGTSAAVAVALIGALRHAASPSDPGAVEPALVAGLAHALEVEHLGWQSGVQDQALAARGGALLLDVRYPEVAARRLVLAAGTREELDARLLTVYLGRPHRSSELHADVIRALERVGPARASARLAPLEDAARRAAAQLEAGDLDGWGATLRDATDAIGGLHPDLVGRSARAAIDVARALGARGWKVNGAGGDGGSVTVLAPPEPPARAALAEALGRLPGARLLPLRLADEGLVCRLA